MNICPSTSFSTVVVDPPWQPTLGASWNSSYRDKARPQRFYRTMSVDEICSIRPSFAPLAHLYVWCVAQHVDWAYRVAAEWKAEPVILWTWKKPGLGVGRFRCNTEHILVCRFGGRIGNPFGQGGRMQQATAGTLFEWPRGRHSEKPDEFYSLVERLSRPPYLDMYARREREGWTTWGDETGSSECKNREFERCASSETKATLTTSSSSSSSFNSIANTAPCFTQEDLDGMLFDAESRVEQLQHEVDSLRAWKAGATGAASISYPPRVGPHTENAYLAHKTAYESGSEDYRIGADMVAAAVMAKENGA